MQMTHGPNNVSEPTPQKDCSPDAVDGTRPTPTSEQWHTHNNCKDGRQETTATWNLTTASATSFSQSEAINPNFTCIEAGSFCPAASAAPGCSRGHRASVARSETLAKGCQRHPNLHRSTNLRPTCPSISELPAAMETSDVHHPVASDLPPNAQTPDPAAEQTSDLSHHRTGNSSTTPTNERLGHFVGKPTTPKNDTLVDCKDDQPGTVRTG